MTNNNSLDWYKNALEKQAQQMKRDQELTEQYKKDVEELRAAQATETPAAPVEETQPAQPLAELEALRAENAALKVNLELSFNHAQSIADKLNMVEFSERALQNGMKEKDAAFNALMAERNQLRDLVATMQAGWERVLAQQTFPNSTLATLARDSIAIINSTLESE